MNFTLLLIKLIMTPLIIAAMTLVARRWGDDIGGLLVGLPLTSGPVSIFFAIEQGHDFAASAANSALLGLIPVAVFFVAYVRSAKHFSWQLSALISLCCYTITIEVLSFLTPGPGLTAFLVPLVLGTGAWILGTPASSGAPIDFPWWDLPLRMAVATSLLILITTGASTLGAKWSGLLSPFPIFSFVMATFSHSRGGAATVWLFLRGAMIGLFSYTVFFLVVETLIGRADLPLVYLLASAAALGINGLFLFMRIWKKRAAAARVQQAGM